MRIRTFAGALRCAIVQDFGLIVKIRIKFIHFVIVIITIIIFSYCFFRYDNDARARLVLSTCLAFICSPAINSNILNVYS